MGYLVSHDPKTGETKFYGDEVGYNKYLKAEGIPHYSPLHGRRVTEEELQIIDDMGV